MPDLQIRLYRANDIFMRDYSKNYQFYYKGDDQIVANVWNADKDWKIEVYENGIKTGEMTHFDYTGNEKDKPGMPGHWVTTRRSRQGRTGQQ